MQQIWKHIAGATVAVSMLATPALAHGADQSATYDEITHEVENIRGLKLKTPMDITIKSREELADDLKGEIGQDENPELHSDDERVLILIGFIDPSTDINQTQTELLTEQVAGYYEPKTNQMVVVSGSGELSAMDKITFAHETEHAIQNQHFDLVKMQTNVENGSDDEQIATLSLIEGDAVFVETQYLLAHPEMFPELQKEIEGIDSTQLDSAPFYMKETLLFPYLSGMEFVTYLHKDGGWEAVNGAWKNPPTTTEQILHPEKYVAGEQGIAIRVVDPSGALGGEWHAIDDNAFGELLTRIFLQNGGASKNDATAAAAGWGGDHMIVSTNGTHSVMVWGSTFDTEEDAQEFARTLIATESGRLGGTTEAVGENNSHMRIHGDTYTGDILIDGSTVRYVLGDDASAVDTAIAAQAGTATPVASPNASPSPITTPVAIRFDL